MLKYTALAPRNRSLFSLSLFLSPFQKGLAFYLWKKHEQMEHSDADSNTSSSHIPSVRQRQFDEKMVHHTFTSIHSARALGMDRADTWIRSPIECGYLCAYSESQFSSENIKFLMAVEAYKDLYEYDVKSWPTPAEAEAYVASQSCPIQSLNCKWEDLEIGGSKEGEWPSRVVARDTVLLAIREIWNVFLSENASLQICVPTSAQRGTMTRLRFLHVYGKRLFDEAVVDPLKTITRDVLPRFFSSPFYGTMVAKLALLDPLPAGATLEVPFPEASRVVTEVKGPGKPALEDLKVPLRQILDDSVLFKSFLVYLRQIVASEGLLFLRLLQVFDKLWESEEYAGHKLEPNYFPPGADELAWKIYCYFIAASSAFEMSIKSSARRQIMQSLACPHARMFKSEEKGAIEQLEHHYRNYFSSDVFKDLPDVIVEERKARAAASAPKFGCF